MGAQNRISEQRPIAIILPARVGHDPVEVVEHSPDQKVGIALVRRQCVVDGEGVTRNQVADDRVAISDGRLAVYQMRKLTARRLRRVEDVQMAKDQAAQLEEGINLQPERVVVRDAEQLGVGI
jgi:hypothetical protein